MNTRLTIRPVLTAAALALVTVAALAWPRVSVPRARQWEPLGRTSQAPSLTTTTLG
jgi:hypothetical protein